MGYIKLINDFKISILGYEVYQVSKENNANDVSLMQ